MLGGLHEKLPAILQSRLIVMGVCVALLLAAFVIVARWSPLDAVALAYAFSL